jgi:hypothetical protein
MLAEKYSTRRTLLFGMLSDGIIQKKFKITTDRHSEKASRDVFFLCSQVLKGQRTRAPVQEHKSSSLLSLFLQHYMTGAHQLNCI